MFSRRVATCIAIAATLCTCASASFINPMVCNAFGSPNSSFWKAWQQDSASNDFFAPLAANCNALCAPRCIAMEVDAAIVNPLNQTGPLPLPAWCPTNNAGDRCRVSFVIKTTPCAACNYEHEYRIEVTGLNTTTETLSKLAGSSCTIADFSLWIGPRRISTKTLFPMCNEPGSTGIAFECEYSLSLPSMDLIPVGDVCTLTVSSCSYLYPSSGPSYSAQFVSTGIVHGLLPIWPTPPTWRDHFVAGGPPVPGMGLQIPIPAGFGDTGDVWLQWDEQIEPQLVSCGDG